MRTRVLPLLAFIVVSLAAVPLVFVAWNALNLEAVQWRELWSARIPTLLWNTLSLAALVTIGATVLGVSSAWLVARRAFPGRTLAVWLMVLPLAVPTYVFAHIYSTLFMPGTWLLSAWERVLPSVAPPGFHGLGGTTFVLILASFSYVFLLVRASLSGAPRSLDEAARCAGLDGFARFRRVTLPLLRPALAAGAAIVVLHVAGDFGAVSMLRFQTFTLAIYLQMSGRFDYQGAAGLSLVLVMLTLTFLVVERFFRKRQRYFTRQAGELDAPRLQRARGLELVLIWGWLGFIALLACAIPLAWMLGWSWEAYQSGNLDARLWRFGRNSFVVALISAGIAVCAALPVALYHVRRRSWTSAAGLHLSSVGFVLPGPVIALGIMVALLAWAPVLYATLAGLVMALVIRFLPLAVQSHEASLQQLTPAVEQAGRSLGAGPVENLLRVMLPMMRGGVAVALVLVFIDALKELPATLLLRPVGFDTLPVRIWIEASEEMLELAAPAALILVAASVPAIWLMLRNGRRS